MIKAKHHTVIYPLFKGLSRFLIHRNFNSVSIHGQFADNGRPMLIIANHVSWWDGFWIMLLNLKILKRKFHFMMLEKQLQKHWYFQYTGGYSIKKNSRSILDSLNYSVELLRQAENMVLMFPQGKIHSLYQNRIVFEKGIERIVEHIAPDTQILFVANLVDYLSDSKPNLYIYIKTYLAKDIIQTDIQLEYNQFYEQVVHAQKTKIS